MAQAGCKNELAEVSQWSVLRMETQLTQDGKDTIEMNPASNRVCNAVRPLCVTDRFDARAALQLGQMVCDLFEEV